MNTGFLKIKYVSGVKYPNPLTVVPATEQVWSYFSLRLDLGRELEKSSLRKSYVDLELKMLQFHNCRNFKGKLTEKGRKVIVVRRILRTI